MLVLITYFYFVDDDIHWFFRRYVWGGSLVVFGIFLNVYSKNRDKIKLPSLAELRKQVLGGRKVRLLSQDV